MQRVASIGPAYDVTILRSRANPKLDGTVICSPVPEPPGNPAMFAGAAVGKAQAMKAQVEQYNAAADAINRRVVETLARATGQELDADPRTWQSWWQEYMCDYYEVEPLPANGQHAAGPRHGRGHGDRGSHVAVRLACPRTHTPCSDEGFRSKFIRPFLALRCSICNNAP